MHFKYSCILFLFQLSFILNAAEFFPGGNCPQLALSLRAISYEIPHRRNLGRNHRLFHPNCPQLYTSIRYSLPEKRKNGIFYCTDTE
jgi:hypothetical protein